MPCYPFSTELLDAFPEELAGNGLKTVSYESGHIDSADVRQVVMTGINHRMAGGGGRSGKHSGGFG